MEDPPRCAKHFIVYNVTHITYSITLLQFSFSAMLLWQRLKIVNCSVTNLVLHGKYIIDKNSDMYIPITYNRKNPKSTMKICAILHGEICKAAKIINEIYGEQLLLTLGRLFIEILNGIHTIISGQSIVLIIYDIFWTIVAAFEIFLIILPTTVTMRNVSRF